jgi:hypothetical protein
MSLGPSSVKILSTVKQDMQDIVNDVAADLPAGWQLIVDAGNRTAEDEMAIWLKCHNMDGTPNGQPHLTGCNGYAIGTTAPNGCAGTGMSNHQGGGAVDVLVEVDGKIIWNGQDPAYRQLDVLMQKAAAHRNIALTWGGDFPPPSKPDWDHWELTPDS